MRDFYEDQTTNYIRSVRLSDVIADLAEQIAHCEWIPMRFKRVTVSLRYLFDKSMSIFPPLQAPIRIIPIQTQPTGVIWCARDGLQGVPFERAYACGVRHIVRA